MSNPSDGNLTGSPPTTPTATAIGATLPTQPITATLPSGIDPTRVSYSLTLGMNGADPTGAGGFSQATLSPITLAWEEQAGQLAVRLTATIANADSSQGPVHQLCALAAPLVLSADWGQGPTEVWRGKIWTWTFADDGAQTIEIVGYDSLMYLQQSEDDRFYVEGQLPGDVLTDIAGAWGLTIGGTGDLPSVALPRLLYQGQKVSSMVLDVLNQTYYFGGGSWILRDAAGTLTVQAPGTNTPIYVLTGDVVTTYRDEQDMTGLVTEVDIRGYDATAGAGYMPGGPVRPPFQSVIAGATEYGTMTSIVRTGTPGLTPLLPAQIAQQLLVDRGQPRRLQRFIAPDLPFLRRGDLVGVMVGTLNGQYWINSISHDATTRTMTIEIDTSGNLASNVNGKVQRAKTTVTSALLGGST